MFGSLFSAYTWFELWGPLCFIVIVLLAYLYIKKLIMVKKYKLTKKHISCFFVAIGLFYLFKGSPFTVIGEHDLLSAHVLGLAVILFIVPPLIILGLPTAFLRSFFWNHRLKHAFAIFAHPWITVIVFNGSLTVYLVPSVFNTVHSHPFLSFVFQSFLFIAALFMWWAIISPVPEMSTLSDFIKIVYVFLAALLLMPIGFFLLLITEPHYSVYFATEQQLFPNLTAVYDQQLAGGLLKAIQLTAFCVALYYIIFNWGRKEEAREGEVDDENIRVVQGIVIHLQDKK